VINKLKCYDCAGVSFVCTLKDEKMAEKLVAGGVWKIPELTHRLAARSWLPGDVGDSAEGVLVVMERVLSVSRSLGVKMSAFG